MRVIISAGGTGGHIYPALAILDKIKEREPDSEFLYIGTHDRMEKDIIPARGIPFESIEIYGFHRKKIWKNGKTIKCFWKAYKKSKEIIRSFHPDIVIGVGGYVTGPVLYAAKKVGCKTLIHEQNSIPGKCNLFLSKYVSKIAISFKSSVAYFPEYKTVYTGNPCSESAIKAPVISKSTFGLTDSKKLVLIVMGSLGASKVNAFLVNSLKSCAHKPYEILFVTGKKDYEEISKNTFSSNIKVVSYIENMTRIMKKTDVIVSRAGASTLSEIIALGLPSILIPSPYVPDNHQYKNALDLENKNAALLLEEKDLKGDILIQKIDEVLLNPSVQAEMHKNLENIRIPNSATLIYETIKKMVSEEGI